MTTYSEEKEEEFARLNERFGGRVRAMYYLSPRNLRIKLAFGNAPVFWTDGSIRRDEKHGNIHISKFEVLALARSKTGLLSPDFEVTIYVLSKDMEKVHRSIEAIESIMLPSADCVLLEVETDRVLDALRKAQEMQDESAVEGAKAELRELQKMRIAWEL